MELRARFPLDGRPRAVTVDMAYDDAWVAVTAVKTFGIASNAWTGKRGKQGLRRQVEKMMRAAAQHAKAPSVVVWFDAVASDVAAALRAMGVRVQGVELDFTTRRAPYLAPPPSIFAAFDRRPLDCKVAMWWRTSRDEIVTPAIERTYRALHCREPHALTSIVKALGLASANAPLVAVGDGTIHIGVRTATGVRAVLGASAEKGIRLFFPTTTDVAYRDACWTELAAWAEACARAFQPDAEPLGGAEWWEAVKKHDPEPGTELGVIMPR